MNELTVYKFITALIYKIKIVLHIKIKFICLGLNINPIIIYIDNYLTNCCLNYWD
jgi:hypothetical protein